jgi:heme A synthase
MSRDDRTRATAGLILFVALSFLGSWCVAASLRVFDLTVSPATIGTRLFTTSLLYAWKRSSRSAGSRSREARGDRRFLAVGFG